jgi:ATP/maltotriose-dependent transcriptional regulator MalT
MIKLLERETPLQELEAALQQAASGEGRVVLVSGEAGIGKTSLVEQFTRQHRSSYRILWGACDSLFTPRPFGPLHDIALQTQGELRATLNSESDRTAIFSACFTELYSQPSIAVLEDIHWADEASLDLIKFLGRRIQRTSSLVILTYRNDELGSRHPLWLLLGDLPRPATNRLLLSPLSKTSVLTLARAAGQAERADDLYATTNGNPFFVSEILAGQNEDMPSTIRDAVLARATRLSHPAHAVLESAAVIGKRVEPWLLSRIVGEEPMNVEECISKGMLQAEGDYYLFRHELARQAVLTTIFPERRLLLHRLTLDALRESTLTNMDLARLANHAEGSKDVSAVLEYAPAAARQASAASSHREANALYELALRFASSLPPADHARMLEAYAVELWFANRLDDSILVLNQAIELWSSLGDRRREGRNLVPVAEASYLAGRKAEAENASRSAIAILEALPPSAELARAYKAQCFIREEDRDCEEAVEWGEKAVALAERFGDQDTLARTYNYMGYAMLILDYQRGEQLFERSLSIGQTANLPFAVGGTLANWGQVLVETYRLTQAEPYLTEGIAYATEHDDHYHLQVMLTFLAQLRLNQGRWREAAEIISRVFENPNTDLYLFTYALYVRARLQVRQGDIAAASILDEALALALQGGAVVRIGYTRASRAEMDWLAGDQTLAVGEAVANYELAVSKAHPWIAGELAFWRWRSGDNFTPPVWIALPYALQITGDWRSAAQEWERRGCPYEQALALMDGDHSAKFRALEIFEQLGARPAAEKLKHQLRLHGARGIPRGPRPTTRQNPFGLTSRELEVLACLAHNSSNQAIARQLNLSTRTVEHHVASILGKMQVSSRHIALDLARKADLLPPE